MARYDNILFPIDLKADSEHVAVHVKEIADAFESDIHMLYVVGMPHHYSEADVAPLYTVGNDADVVEAAENELREYRERYLHGEPVRVNVATGNAGEEILRHAKLGKMDLVIMGHSRKGIERLILGSVSDYVVKRSSVPVMIVNDR